MRQRIGLIAGVVLFFLVLLLPSFPGMDATAQRMAAVTALMVTWWITEAISISATALVPLALLPLLGITSASEAAAPYADQTIFLFMGGFCIALTMEKWNLHRRIALHIVRLFGSQPRHIILGFMVATALISMWISNTATAMMMLPIAMALLQHLEQKVSSKFGTALMLGIAYAASIGGIGTLIGTPPNLVFAGQVGKLFPGAPEIGFVQWMQIGLPFVAAFIPLVWLYLIHVACRFENTPSGPARDVVAEQLRSLGPMTRGERVTLTIFALTCAAWIFRQDISMDVITIPGWTRWFSNGSWIQDSTVAMTAAVVLMIIPVNFTQMEFALDWKTAVKLPWGILILFGGGFALAGGLMKSGLAQWIGQAFVSYHLSPLGMIIFVCLVTTFVTEVTSNTATATMLMPILAPVAVALNMHPFALMIPAAISASCAFMMPVATPPNAIVFSTGHVTIPQMARTGLVLNLIAVVLTIFTVYYLMPAAFGLNVTEVPGWAR
ncbi:MAG: DASS family sodium-coupled anion symporter [Bacteroidetes bacterium]|nr:DASS family sodium-coupled anion symporter [Bacteroidota bacterium]